MIQLIAFPAAFDGKRVAVAGYCHLEFEGNGLFLHEEDFARNLSTNAVRLRMPYPLPANYKAANDSYVAVEGTFRAPSPGAPGFRGTLADITRLWKVPSHAEMTARK
jgi:hypothetical protein